MLLVLLSAEVAPILSATPAVITAVARFLTVLLLPSSLKVLPRLPLLLTKLIEAWVASDRKAAFAMAAEVPVTTVPLGKCRCIGTHTFFHLTVRPFERLIFQTALSFLSSKARSTSWLRRVCAYGIQATSAMACTLRTGYAC